MVRYRNVTRRSLLKSTAGVALGAVGFPSVISSTARAGKAIYLEKPMGLSLAEDQVLRATCHRYGTIFQFGTQQRSSRDWTKEQFVNNDAANRRLVRAMRSPWQL